MPTPIVLNEPIKQDALNISHKLKKRHFTKTPKEYSDLISEIKQLEHNFINKYKMRYNDYINCIERNALLITKQLDRRRTFLQCKDTEEVKNINNLIQGYKKNFFETYNQSYDDYIKIRKIK